MSGGVVGEGAGGMIIIDLMGVSQELLGTGWSRDDDILGWYWRFFFLSLWHFVWTTWTVGARYDDDDV